MICDTNRCCLALDHHDPEHSNPCICYSCLHGESDEMNMNATHEDSKGGLQELPKRARAPCIQCHREVLAHAAMSADCGKGPLHQACLWEHVESCETCEEWECDSCSVAPSPGTAEGKSTPRMPPASDGSHVEAGDGSHVAAYVHAKQDLEHPKEDICRSFRWPSSLPSQASDPQAPEAVPQAVVLTALPPSDRLHVAASASHVAAPQLLPNTNQSAFTFSLPFTLQKAHLLRGRGEPKCYHKALRARMKTVSASDGMSPLRIEVSDELPWREYIASHASYDSLIGTGVEDFFLQFRRKSDPNRGGKSRLDFVIKRCDGSHVLLHPGTKRNNDAQPIVLVAGEFEALI